MTRMLRCRSLFAFTLFLAFTGGTVASAQTNSTATPVTLNATLSSSISVSASASSYTWSSLTAGGTTAAGATVTLTTTWVLASSVNHVELDCYFATPAHAMTDGASHYIPASAIFGVVSGADTVSSTALTATTTLGPASAGLTIFNHTLSADYNSNRVDTLALSINLNGVTIPAGTYTGTLTFQAQAL